MKNNKYYQFYKENNKGIINIYGDITSDRWCESDVSSLSFADELNSLGNVDEIEVYINSYGGEVGEGISIFNQLKNHKAKVITICNGFACSISSILFLAGDERKMCKNSLLMIHSPFVMMQGNANELRAEAEVLDKMEKLSIDIYCQVSGLDEVTIKQMLDNETWLNSEEALQLGFATEIIEDKESNLVVQSVKNSLAEMIKQNQTKEVLQMEEQPKEIIEEVVNEVVEEQPQLEEKIEMEETQMKLENNKNTEMEMLEMEMNRDREIMETRGQRKLTVSEEKFYDKFIMACKSRNPQQAFIELEGNEETAMPETIMEDVFKGLVQEHQLLGKVNGIYASYATKWIVNDKSKQTAQWGEIDGEITKEVMGAFRTIDLKQHKLSAFAQIPNGILELGRTFLDAYIRRTLAESIANALEEAIVNGDGANSPVGMMRQVQKGVAVSDGVHPAKEAQAITDLSPKTFHGIIAKMAVYENGANRNINKVQLIVNNVDYLTHILPAVQLQNGMGQFVEAFPFPTEVIICNAVPSGKAIFAVLDEYFLGLASGKDGKIEFSDEYKFLEDKRTFRVKLYATGRMMDNNASQVVDITGLGEAMLKVKND